MVVVSAGYKLNSYLPDMQIFTGLGFLTIFVLCEDDSGTQYIRTVMLVHAYNSIQDSIELHDENFDF